MKLKNTKFNKCKLQEVDFSETDLTNASFNNCDLIGSIFNATILEKADFRTSYNYSIDPEINRLKKAKFSLQGVVGLLGKYQIEIE
ncbi:MAG: pentapeptide repeat-containing protein [Lutibacter sp.]